MSETGIARESYRAGVDDYRENCQDPVAESSTGTRTTNKIMVYAAHPLGLS